MNTSEIAIQDYNYELPTDRIALHPLPKRDASKLLLYKNGMISETKFEQLPAHIPSNSLMLFNNTKVINARISFQKSTGTPIEIFCLEPADTVLEYSTAMGRSANSTWKCFVGGASKWKSGFLEKTVLHNGKMLLLKAEKTGQVADAYLIRFSWEPTEYSFAEILQSAGDVPLPPYIKRSTTSEDHSRYQTIFANHEGSVAAPTAGLHFTDHIFEQLSKQKITHGYVTLHVGAGTFKPVKALQIKDHEMHAEYIDIPAETIRLLLDDKTIIPVGTTSLRSIESLYWMGVKIFLDPEIKNPELGQWEVYKSPLFQTTVTRKESLGALLQWMKQKNMNNLFSKTQIIIAPGYQFKIAHFLVTNFHQPQSTLLLLVAAAIGDDWRKMYAYALKNEFRFLSYGDANLIQINNRMED